ncbi:MAG TPA: hypothetical protein VKD90_11015 [Gemmataceae bacterium]|nr:hypothetical protein [Gemmataceae bacterium]
MRRALLILSVLVLPAVAFAQGKLEQVRDAVDSSRSSDDKPKCDTKSDASNDSSAPCDPQPSWGGGGGPWLEDPERLFSGDGRFAAYPYAAAGTPYLWLNDSSGGWFAARASAEVGSDFDGLTRAGFRLFLDTEFRFGLKSDWDYYSERLACGCRDDLWLGDVTGTYRVVQTEAVQIYGGLGARFLLDHGRNRGGFNVAAGFDAFPAKPVHLFGSADAGNIGDAAFWRLHGGAGLTWGHAELFAGYDFVRIGGVDLQGPFLGVRVWY